MFACVNMMMVMMVGILGVDGNVVWKRDFGAVDNFTHMQSNPDDLRQLVLNTKSGIFSVLTIESLENIIVKRFEASIGDGSLMCWVPGSHDLVALVLQREVCVYFYIVLFQVFFLHFVYRSDVLSGLGCRLFSLILMLVCRWAR